MELNTSQLGNTAVKAYQLLRLKSKLTAKQAWEDAISKSTLSNSTKGKCCAKNSFIGLIEYGCAEGIPAKESPSSNKQNAKYAYIAWQLLNEENIPKKKRAYSAPSQLSLWRKVLAKLKIPSKAHNSQMDIVISLWINGII